MKKPLFDFDIIMNSSFDINSGGRETWLYNFLKELLKDPKVGTINLFGCRSGNQKDFTQELLKLDPFLDNKKRLSVNILKVTKSRLPQAFYFHEALSRYFKTVSEIKPQFVLGVGFFELVIINKLKRYKNVKKVIWLRSIFLHEKAYAIPKIARHFFKKYETRQLKNVDVILCNGDDIKEFYESQGLKLFVVKNGVDISRWKLAPPKLRRPINVSYIGRLSKVKGIEDYLELIQLIGRSKNYESFTFHIVGDNGVYKDQVEDLVKGKLVKNHNLIPNELLPKFLNQIDVCVGLTYASENGGGGGTSNAMMEQMAAGRVLLTWDNRIFRQYLSSENAYLAKQGSVIELERQLINIASNSADARKRALEGLKSIKPFSFKLNVVKFKNIIESEM